MDTVSLGPCPTHHGCGWSESAHSSVGWEERIRGRLQGLDGRKALGHGEETGGSRGLAHPGWPGGSASPLPGDSGHPQLGGLPGPSDIVSGSHSPQPQELQSVAGGAPPGLCQAAVPKPPGVSLVLWGSRQCLRGPQPRLCQWAAQPVGLLCEASCQAVHARQNLLQS